MIIFLRGIFKAIPSHRDPRWFVASLQAIYLLIGIRFLGFNRSPAQIFVTIASAMLVDVLFQFLYRRWNAEADVKFPLSGIISGLGLSIILNYPHGIFYPLLPVVLSIASKYLLTHNGRHIFNPTLFGAALTIFFTQGAISSAPSYQWGGTVLISLFIVTGALVLFMPRIARKELVVTFLVSYFVATVIRAYYHREVIPVESTFLSALTSPALYLFTFFMITDPATSPKSRVGQIVMSLTIVGMDLYLQLNRVLSSIIWATFFYFTCRFLWLHVEDFLKGRRTFPDLALGTAWRGLPLALCCWLSILAFQNTVAGPGLENVRLKLTETIGVFPAHDGEVMSKLDPRIAHVGKWVLSIGDAAAVADFDGDGKQDVFLTGPLKDAGARARLYRNLGSYRFEVVETPALDEIRAHPESRGIVSGALWLDYDNDGDQDLFVLVSYGKLRLLRNLLKETGKAEFEDVSELAGISEHAVSVAAVATDLNQDGFLDLVVGHSFTRSLPGYGSEVPFNPFRLPAAEFDGDRRMFNFMNRSFHDANNGGGFSLYLANGKGGFESVDPYRYGLKEQRWVLDVGAADFNEDGWPDLYASNDFGPDQFFINERGTGMRAVRGNLAGELGKDTYKGMNVTVADFDNNGHQDIYVSNMHKRLQPEGSMLWMNYGGFDRRGYLAFAEESQRRGVQNLNRFGWGAAAADLDRDGWVDLLVANGYLDRKQENPPRDEKCPDYWYWQNIIATSVPDVHGYADQWADLRGRCFFADESNRAYLNRGGEFFDVSESVGLKALNTARGVAVADFENRGVLDALVTRMSEETLLLKNEPGNENGWLGLSLAGNGRDCNRDAIGTRVAIKWNDRREQRVQTREHAPKNGLSAQNDSRMFFGLGEIDAHQPIEVSVRWCGTGSATDYRLEPNRYHELRQVP